MSCFKPITGFRNDLGQVTFHNHGDKEPIQVPCGNCLNCRLERSRQWAMRCVHEASMHQDNCFITLTYDAENIPPDAGLRKKDFQNFMKALRNKTNEKIRFYQCGEYGDKSNRPHYHAILFGFNFDDWLYLFDSPSGNPIYTSPTLEKIWKKGFVTIGECTFESAAYIARYCMKKINGKLADKRDEKTGLKPYERVNQYTGEIIKVVPEYSTMSRRPGIAHNWIADYTRDVYPKDYTTIRGMRLKPPKYYDKYLGQIDNDMYDDIKQGRILEGYESLENTEPRLRDRQVIKEAQFKQLKRSL